VAHTEGSAGPLWKKSSQSSHAGNCVEVAALPEGVIGVRDSKESGPGRTVLAFSRAGWDCFLAGIKAGGLDLP
jgi:hypothetical protein